VAQILRRRKAATVDFLGQLRVTTFGRVWLHTGEFCHQAFGLSTLDLAVRYSWIRNKGKETSQGPTRECVIINILCSHDQHCAVRPMILVGICATPHIACVRALNGTQTGRGRRRYSLD
jgi:hypothetical protein